MSMSTSLSKRRAVVVINYSLLLATLLLSQTGHWFEWSIVTKVCFIVLVISWIIFKEKLNLLQWLFGMVLIIGAAISIWAQEHIKAD